MIIIKCLEEGQVAEKAICGRRIYDWGLHLVKRQKKRPLQKQRSLWAQLWGR